MKHFKFVMLTALAGLLLLGLFAVPGSKALAQTGGQSLSGVAPIGGTMGFMYPDGALSFGTYVNGVWTQIAWFSPALVALSASGPITVTDPQTGFQTTIAPGSTPGTRIVTIRDAGGTIRATYTVNV